MADSLALAGARSLRFPAVTDGAVELVGRSIPISRVQELVRRAADTDGPVLLIGERGVDVASVARELHMRARGAERPFIQIECAGRDAASLDRELFGTTTGIAPPDLEAAGVDGRLAAARGGTLFLHEIADIPAAVQVRLARVMRDREMRVNGEPVPIDFRVMATALPGIDEDAHAHRFRPDLFRRLSSTRIDLPSLRERADDIPALAARLLDEACAAGDGVRRVLTQTALALLGALTWPGNLAELRSAIERAVQETRDEVIQIDHLLPVLPLDRAPTPFVPSGNLREARLKFERDYIAAVLQHCGWRMADAAQTLGIQRPNLYRKARQLGIPVTRMPEHLS
jgi:DNA-binding NtrC family response regulator